ncbi:MAG: nucleoside deaminase [Ruminococcus sp.]|nr:nucleoside deaminase [Ruminococcus sp.]
MWKDLTFQWQTVLEEAWTAFTNGSIPVGAAVFDKNGDLLVKDHNRRSEPQTLNPRTAHAELNVLQHIDCRGGLNIREIQLYTSMEPCPMCMGAIVMSNIKSLNCGSHDRWCGALHLLDTDPYMRSQHISVSEIPEETEFFQLVLSSYHELKHIRKGGSPSVLDCFRISSAPAVEAAETLCKNRVLDQFAQMNKPCSEVYDLIIQIKEEQNV